MRKTLAALSIAVMLPSFAAAQESAARRIATQAAPTEMTTMQQVRSNFDRVARFITRSAEQMPEEHYSFRPTPDVRTFGEILGHIANAQFGYCSAALGVENPNETNFEKETSKAALVAAVKKSFDHCKRAYDLSDAEAMKVSEANGRTTMPFVRILGNATHMWEHYGNLVTYLRIKGLVPPSSQRGRM